MNGNIIDPLPGYIIDINKGFSPGYVSKTRKARNAAIEKKKRKLEEGVASGKIKMDKPSLEYDTTDDFGRVLHVEWRGGHSFYSSGHFGHN